MTQQSMIAQRIDHRVCAHCTNDGSVRLTTLIDD
jgi:hypothetical protein